METCMDHCNMSLGQLNGNVTSMALTNKIHKVEIFEALYLPKPYVNHFHIQVLCWSLWSKGHVALFKFHVPRKMSHAHNCWQVYQVCYSETVKYLGVYFDKRLNWNFHVKEKVKNAKHLLIKVQNASGKLWGLHPKMSLWQYQAIVRKTFDYGNDDKAHLRTRITSLQRLALTSLGHFKHGTPTAGLEVITHTTPLHLHIKQEALMAYYRTTGMSKREEGSLKCCKHTLVGHRQSMQTFAESMVFLRPQSDNIERWLHWDMSEWGHAQGRMYENTSNV